MGSIAEPKLQDPDEAYERVYQEELDAEHTRKLTVEQPTEWDRLDDDLAAARGVIFGTVCGALCAIGLAAWIYYGGLWRWLQ